MQLATDQGTRVGLGASTIKRVLIVGDVSNNAGRLFKQLRGGTERVEITPCQRGRDALEHWSRTAFDCVVAAERLPDMAGVSLLGQIISAPSATPVGKVLVRSVDEPFTDRPAMMAAYGIHEVVEAVERSDINTAHRVWSAISQARLATLALDQRVAERLYSVETERWHNELDARITSLMHSLRTPLSVVQESVSLVMEGVCGPLNDDQQKFLAQARGGCGAIERHLAELLSFVRAYPDSELGSAATCNLVAVVDQMVEDASNRFRPERLQLAVGRNTDIPRVCGDAGVITNALWHLLQPLEVDGPHRAVSFLLEMLGDDETTVRLKVTKSGPHCTDPGTPADAEAEIGLHVARYLFETQGAVLHVDELSGSCQSFSIDFAAA